MSAAITGVRRRGEEVVVVLADGTTVTGDLLLVAAGRRPDTGDLGLDLAGVRLRDDGRIQVDAFGRTTAEGIWSLGDASSPFELKHVANAEARAVARPRAIGCSARSIPTNSASGAPSAMLRRFTPSPHPPSRTRETEKGVKGLPNNAAKTLSAMGWVWAKGMLG